MKTFINWSGNKSKHINKIIKYIPDFSGTYIEPFVGSGALLLKLQPEKWIINDINKDLITIWKNIKNNPDEIIKIFKEFGKDFKNLSKENKIKYCREITTKIEDLPYDIKRSSIYLLMKFCAYMGNILIKNKIKFPSLNIRILDNKYYFLEQSYFQNLNNVSKFLNNSKGQIYNKDYTLVLDKAKNGDFEAIKEMAYKMAPLISKDSHLIPIPNRMGIANMTLQLAIEINKITGNPISNIMKGKNRSSVYDIKKLGKILEPNTLGFYLNDTPPKKSTLIDNVYATGYTMRQALSLVKNSDIVVYSRDYSLMIN